MKILALEFSSAQRSVGVQGEGALRDLAPAASHGHCEVIETSGGRTMQPFQMIEAALRQANLERTAIECLVVGLGPGSYNGIRAGIAVAQGWQLAAPVKLLGVSSALALATQAHEAGQRGRIDVVIDAQRGEWYLSVWELDEAGAHEVEPLRIVSAAEVQARAANGGAVLGPEATRVVPSAQLMYPRAATLARLAVTRTDFVPGEALEPIYLRETTFVKAPPPRVV
jgi:tRNA threonylcarbamoyl adenosine modification protein YeaZ